jgi:hypothetical protein
MATIRYKIRIMSLVWTIYIALKSTWVTNSLLGYHSNKSLYFIELKKSYLLGDLITYVPFYQIKINHVVFFWYYILYFYATKSKE